MRTCGIVSTAWLVISCRLTHSRMSSTGRLHASLKASTVALTTWTSGEAGRGMGRSYWPNERRDRWPTIEPTDMPSIIGDSICMRPPNMARPGSLSSTSVPAAAAAEAAPSVPARCWNSGR